MRKQKTIENKNEKLKTKTKVLAYNTALMALNP